jgi:hypothetical protein
MRASSVRVPELLERRHPLTLCRRYFSTHFAESRVQVLIDAASTDLAVTWAVGVLADGDWEVLGAWHGAAVGTVFWRGVWDELARRGVDKISWVFAADRDARSMCSTAKVIPPFRRILNQECARAGPGVADVLVEPARAVREAASVDGARVGLASLLSNLGAYGRDALASDWPEVLTQFAPFYAQRPHSRALLRKGDEVVEHLRRILSRAVVRHAPFVSAEAAIAFVSDTLARAEQRLTLSELANLTPSPRHGVDFAMATAAS